LFYVRPEPDRLMGYGSLLIAGLTACAAAAATVHADGAALVILAVVTLVGLAIALVMRRDGRL
jgi:hypothetical protein